MCQIDWKREFWYSVVDFDFRNSKSHNKPKQCSVINIARTKLHPYGDKYRVFSHYFPRILSPVLCSGENVSAETWQNISYGLVILLGRYTTWSESGFILVFVLCTCCGRSYSQLCYVLPLVTTCSLPVV